MNFDKNDWQDLNSTSAQEFEEKRQRLKTCIAEQRLALKEIKSLDEFYLFCEAFQAKTETDRPISLTIGKTNDADFQKLKKYEYPDDFMAWHRSYGNVYCWLESTKLSPSDSVVEELENDYYGLLTYNRFLFITSDGGGNGFFYDMHSAPPTIKFINHNGYFSSDEDSLEEFYSEELGFWFDDDENDFVNEQGLNPDKVFDADKKYHLDSEYIQTYLAECLEPTGSSNLLEFLIAQTLQGFDDVLDRYQLA